MVASDIASGIGVTVVDPHGQLVEEILDNHIPRHRANDVIYLNPTDQARALGLNVLETVSPHQRSFVYPTSISIFHKLREEWKTLLRNGLLALIEHPTRLYF